jgi:hypothetical protein
MEQVAEIAQLFTILKEASEHGDRFVAIKAAAMRKLLEIEKSLPKPVHTGHQDAKVRHSSHS